MRLVPVLFVPVLLVPVLLVPVLLAGLLVPLASTRAQVTTNDSALDSLSAPKPTHSRPETRPAPRATHSAPAHSTPTHSTAPSAAAKPTKPSIPVTPPAILALPPAIAVPLAHPPTPPVVPLADDAPGTATAMQNGIRITFGTGRADLSPATADTIAKFAAGLVDQGTTSLNVFAYAPGNSDDPSTPRRLSLQRALAVRAVLMKAGLPSARIYPRALGPLGGDQPDRVDIVTGAPTPPPTAPASMTPSTPKAAGRAG